MKLLSQSSQRIARFLREQLTAQTLGERAEPISGFSLVHVEAGVSEREVKTIKIGGPVEPADLARNFIEAATDYASELANGGSGMQQFVLYALVDGITEPVASYPLKASGESYQTFMGTEPASPQGLMGQMMRHNEALMQASLTAVGRVNDQLLSLHTRMLENQEKMTTRHFEVLELAETLVMQAAEGEHKKKIEILQLEQKMADRSKLLSMAPALANMLTGSEIFPQSSADTSILESLAIDLDTEDLRMLTMMLEAKVKNKEILGVLLDRLGKIIDDKERRKGQVNGTTSVGEVVS